MFEYQEILILAPHPDDDVLGCGATVSRLRSMGANINVACFSSCDESRPSGFRQGAIKDEFYDACKIIGYDRIRFFDFPVRQFQENRQAILDKMISLRKSIQPDLVICPSSCDVHQDHEVICRESFRAFKSTSAIIGYELPWNSVNFSGSLFCSIEKQDLETKIKALGAYKSQNGRKYFNPDFIRSLAVVRGVQSGKHELAERFEIRKMI